jgi:hypothetical protein
MKLLVDIINITLVRKVFAQQSTVPSELWKRFEASIIRSTISSRWMGKRWKVLTAAQDKLQTHVKRLARYLLNVNKRFLYMLLHADTYVNELPGYYSLGSAEEVVIYFRTGYAS